MKIAYKNNLKVVYDAAHSFSVKYKEKSILSFHATKLFHTIEGGALIINDDNLVEKARYLRNFGIPHLGTNEAAMGLCVLDDFKNIIKEK